MRQKRRKIVVDDTTYIWSTRSRSDKAGRDAVALSVNFERSGPQLLVFFGHTNVVLPRAVREVILFARGRGWAPKVHKHTFQIRPIDALEIAGHTVTIEPWLNQWAPGTLYQVYTSGQVDLARTLEVPPVDGTLDVFRNDDFAIERNVLWTKSYDLLVAAIRRDIHGSIDVRTKSNVVDIYSVADIPRIVTTRSWPDAQRFLGFREHDENWVLDDRIEVFHHHPDGSALWMWNTIWPERTLERRFRAL